MVLYCSMKNHYNRDALFHCKNCLCCWDLVQESFEPMIPWSDQVCKSNFLGHVVIFTDQSCREGSCKWRKPRGRCKWSRWCRVQLRSHQCFQSSQGRSSRSHIHSCSRCVCYCMCLRSDRRWAAVCIHPHHRCKTDLQTKGSSFQKDNLNSLTEGF